jgi:hypothetical protein
VTLANRGINTDAKRAYCAAQWVLGSTKKQIAEDMGVKTIPTVNAAIWGMMTTYARPEYFDQLRGDGSGHAAPREYMPVAEKAVRRWYESLALIA